MIRFPRPFESGTICWIAVIIAGLAFSMAPEIVQAVASSGENKATVYQEIDECANPRPEWVFCNCFEDGNLDVWDDNDGNPPETNLLLEEPGPLGLVGNHVVRLRVPPGRGVADLVKVLPEPHARLYVRWYMRWEPGYDFSARNHGGGLFAGDRNLLGAGAGYRPDGTDKFIATLEPRRNTPRMNAYVYYPGMYQDCVDPEGVCWGDHFPCMLDEGENYCTKPQHRETVLPPVMETGRWYCIEMLLDGGTPTSDPEAADGVLNFWIDGLEIGPWDDLWFRTIPELKITVLWLALFHHDEHSVEGIMFDNVVVSTIRIGAIGEDPGSPAEPSSWGNMKSLYH